jgi:hypothetical protein
MTLNRPADSELLSSGVMMPPVLPCLSPDTLDPEPVSCLERPCPCFRLPLPPIPRHPSPPPAVSRAAAALALPTFLTSCSTSASTRTMRSPMCRARPGPPPSPPTPAPYAPPVPVCCDVSSGNSWLTHVVPRRWQPMQTASAAGLALSKTHRILRRLHSQQERVPLRILRRLACPSAAAAAAAAAVVEACCWNDGLVSDRPGEPKSGSGEESKLVSMLASVRVVRPRVMLNLPGLLAAEHQSRWSPSLVDVPELTPPPASSLVDQSGSLPLAECRSAAGKDMSNA